MGPEDDVCSPRNKPVLPEIGRVGGGNTEWEFIFRLRRMGCL